MNNKKIDLKHSNHLKVINILKEKRLNYLIKSYNELVFLIPPNSQKKIFYTFNKILTALEYKDFLIKYFDKYKVSYVQKEIKKYDDTTNAERNKRYIEKQKKRNRVKLSFFVDSSFIDKINRLKSFKNGDFAHSETYEDFFKILLNDYYSSRFK